MDGYDNRYAIIGFDKTETRLKFVLFYAIDSPTPISDSLVGILSGIGDIDLDEIRMERLAKHLK